MDRVKIQIEKHRKELITAVVVGTTVYFVMKQRQQHPTISNFGWTPDGDFALKLGNDFHLFAHKP